MNADEHFRAEVGYDTQVERVARGVGVSSAGQGVGRLLGYATHASVAWMHGPAQLGFYALGITVVQVASSSGWTTAWCDTLPTTGPAATWRGCVARYSSPSP
jgi:2-methylcitrate dehydratase PrpD